MQLKEQEGVDQEFLKLQKQKLKQDIETSEALRKRSTEMQDLTVRTLKQGLRLRTISFWFFVVFGSLALIVIFAEIGVMLWMSFGR